MTKSVPDFEAERIGANFRRSITEERRDRDECSESKMTRGRDSTWLVALTWLTAAAPTLLAPPLAPVLGAVAGAAFGVVGVVKGVGGAAVGVHIEKVKEDKLQVREELVCARAPHARALSRCRGRLPAPAPFRAPPPHLRRTPAAPLPQHPPQGFDDKQAFLGDSFEEIIEATFGKHAHHEDEETAHDNIDENQVDVGAENTTKHDVTVDGQREHTVHDHIDVEGDILDDTADALDKDNAEEHKENNNRLDDEEEEEGSYPV